MIGQVEELMATMYKQVDCMQELSQEHVDDRYLLNSISSCNPKRFFK